MTNSLTIEVVYLSPDEQAMISLNIPKDTSVLEAIYLSQLLEKFPEIDLKKNKVGIFGKMVPLETTVNAGDRIEIYRQLLIDPKQKRLLNVTASRVEKFVNLRSQLTANALHASQLIHTCIFNFLDPP